MFAGGKEKVEVLFDLECDRLIHWLLFELNG